MSLKHQEIFVKQCLELKKFGPFFMKYRPETGGSDSEGETPPPENLMKYLNQLPASLDEIYKINLTKANYSAYSSRRFDSRQTDRKQPLKNNMGTLSESQTSKKEGGGEGGAMMFGANSECGSSIQLAPADQQDFKLDLTEINSEIDKSLHKNSIRENQHSPQISGSFVSLLPGANAAQINSPSQVSLFNRKRNDSKSPKKFIFTKQEKQKHHLNPYKQHS